MAEKAYSYYIRLVESNYGKDTLESSNCYFLLGLFYIENGYLNKAMAAIKMCLNMRITNLKLEDISELQHSSVSDCFHNMSLIYLLNNKPISAIKLLKESLSSRENSSQSEKSLTETKSRELLGIGYAEIKHYERALILLDGTLKNYINFKRGINNENVNRVKNLMGLIQNKRIKKSESAEDSTWGEQFTSNISHLIRIRDKDASRYNYSQMDKQGLVDLELQAVSRNFKEIQRKDTGQSSEYGGHRKRNTYKFEQKYIRRGGQVATPEIETPPFIKKARKLKGGQIPYKKTETIHYGEKSQLSFMKKFENRQQESSKFKEDNFKFDEEDEDKDDEEDEDNRDEFGEDEFGENQEDSSLTMKNNSIEVVRMIKKQIPTFGDLSPATPQRLSIRPKRQSFKDLDNINEAQIEETHSNSNVERDSDSGEGRINHNEKDIVIQETSIADSPATPHRRSQQFNIPNIVVDCIDDNDDMKTSLIDGLPQEERGNELSDSWKDQNHRKRNSMNYPGETIETKDGEKFEMNIISSPPLQSRKISRFKNFNIPELKIGKDFMALPAIPKGRKSEDISKNRGFQQEFIQDLASEEELSSTGKDSQPDVGTIVKHETQKSALEAIDLDRALEVKYNILKNEIFNQKIINDDFDVETHIKSSVIYDRMDDRQRGLFIENIEVLFPQDNNDSFRCDF